MVTATTDAVSAPLTPERPSMATSAPNEELDTVSVALQGPERHVRDDERALASTSSSSSPSMSSASSLVTLVSSDGYALTVPRRIAEESGTIKSLLSSKPDDSSSSSSTPIIIPLPNIRRRELISIFQFCERQLRASDELSAIREREEREAAAAAGAGKSVADDKAASASATTAASLAASVRASFASEASSWATSGSFGTGGRAQARSSPRAPSRTLLGRTLAANYLDVPAALEACADAVAEGVRGRSPAEIRARFGIAPDLTREEEESIKADCAWAFDCC